MFKYVLIILCSASLLLVATPQERTKKKGPEDFAKTIERAKASWQAENYGACMKDLQACTNLVVQKRREAIRAAMPAAPAGWTIQEETSMEDPASNPMFAAMTASIGSVVERTYEQSGGEGRLDVSVMADSPMVQMLSMMFANPSLVGPEAETVGYGAHKGLLNKEDGSLNLQVLIAATHVIEVKLQIPGGMKVDAAEGLLFGLIDQAAVDKLAAVLTR